MIAFGASGAITALVATFWITSFGYFYGDKEVRVAVEEKNTQTSPLVVIRSGMASAYEALTGSRVVFEKNSANNNATATLEYVPE
jgi:hypothetical protein